MPNLPIDLLKKRIQQELNLCERKLEHKISIEDSTLSSFPIEVRITMVNSPGPVMKNDKITNRFTHEFLMKITDQYPYEKPLVRWQTPIFHPNIMLPKDGGHVCTRLLDDWGFQSNLLSFIKGIESLLSNPNPKSPWGSNSCTKAAEHFNKSQYNPPVIVKSAVKGPKIVTND